MKKLFYLFLVLPLFFVACSDDDDNGNGGKFEGKLDPSVVFTGGQPKALGDVVISYNADGLVTEMKSPSEKVAFQYNDKLKTKATEGRDYDVFMSYEDSYDKYEFYMKLGSNGFVTTCTQVDMNSKDKEIETWKFKYNSDGQLSEMFRSEGENEVTTITYKDGNIVAVKMVSDEAGEGFDAKISYTSETHKEGIDNKGCIMLFDNTFGIDMDEMEYAYFAGILGKATKKLPLKLTEVEIEDGKEYTDIYDFEWTLNEKGLPSKLEAKEEGYTNTFEFKW